MEQGQLDWIANFIWGIAAAAPPVIRKIYKRGTEPKPPEEAEI